MHWFCFRHIVSLYISLCYVVYISDSGHIRWTAPFIRWLLCLLACRDLLIPSFNTARDAGNDRPGGGDGR